MEQPGAGGPEGPHPTPSDFREGETRDSRDPEMNELSGPGSLPRVRGRSESRGVDGQPAERSGEGLEVTGQQRGGPGAKGGWVGPSGRQWGPCAAKPGGKGGRTAALTIVRVRRRPGRRRRRSLLPSRRRTATSSRRAAHADGDSAARHWPAWWPRPSRRPRPTRSHWPARAHSSCHWSPFLRLRRRVRLQDQALPGTWDAKT